MGHGGIYISDHELQEIFEDNNRERSKLELRLEKLEATISYAKTQAKRGAGEWVSRVDYEKLQEDFDELLDMFKELTNKVVEISLAVDLDFDKLGTNPRDEIDG